jgi:hypothetical protein
MFLQFWKGKGSSPPGLAGHPADVLWQRDERSYFHRLLRLHPSEAGLSGVGGVYVLWHRGTRPQWIYVGATDDLGEAIDQARDAPEVLNFEGRGSVYVTWSPIKSEYRVGVVAYLRTTLTPEIDAVFDSDYFTAGAAPIAVIPPTS